MEKNEKTSLSEREKKRIEKFKMQEKNLIEKGYEPISLTTSIKKANIFSILLMIFTGLLLAFTYFSIHDVKKQIINYLDRVSLVHLIFLLVAIFFATFVLIVIHEGIHGVTWGIFAQGSFQSIEFGFIKEKMVPYCYCYSPLKKGQYITGSLMPLILLGILPTLLGLIMGNIILLYLGWMMIASAAGDIIASYKLLAYELGSKNAYIFDHPIELGMVVYEK